MKRDGRTFDHQTLERIRRMAIERVREGEPASKVIGSYGFNRTMIYKWISSALRPGMGIRALRSTPATGRLRSLTPVQEKRVFRWVNGRDPRQYGLDFGLWTRAGVAELLGRSDDSMYEAKRAGRDRRWRIGAAGLSRPRLGGCLPSGAPAPAPCCG